MHKTSEWLAFIPNKEISTEYHLKNISILGKQTRQPGGLPRDFVKRL
jgi:hypothetical protein